MCLGVLEELFTELTIRNPLHVLLAVLKVDVIGTAMVKVDRYVHCLVSTLVKAAQNRVAVRIWSTLVLRSFTEVCNGSRKRIYVDVSAGK